LAPPDSLAAAGPRDQTTAKIAQKTDEQKKIGTKNNHGKKESDGLQPGGDAPRNAQNRPEEAFEEGRDGTP